MKLKPRSGRESDVQSQRLVTHVYKRKNKHMSSANSDLPPSYLGDLSPGCPAYVSDRLVDCKLIPVQPLIEQLRFPSKCPCRVTDVDSKARPARVIEVVVTVVVMVKIDGKTGCSGLDSIALQCCHISGRRYCLQGSA
jgi:hypothetical protein